MEINFQHVNFKYDNKQNYDTLNDINLTISSKDEFITIVGHTGSGKSTLVQLMNALIFPSSGNLTLFGQKIKSKRNKPLKKIRQKVGLVFQFPEYQLFEETVLKDIMFGPQNFGMSIDEAKESALNIIKELNISEEILERPPFNLSGGQKQRVAIARARATNPSVLLCEEPTSALDPSTTEEILNVLNNINKQLGVTIVIVSHEMSVIKSICNRVTVLDQGSIFETVSIKPTGVRNKGNSAQRFVDALKSGEQL